MLKTLAGGYPEIASRIGGLDVLPVFPSVDLSGDNGGTAKLTPKVSLPSAFSALPGSQNSLSADLVVTASNDKGVFFGGKLRVGSAWFGALHVKDLELGYDDQTNRLFDGAFGPQIGAAGVATSPELRVGATVGLLPCPRSSDAACARRRSSSSTSTSRSPTRRCSCRRSAARAAARSPPSAGASRTI